MTPGAFIAKWRAAELKERSAAQEHFIDLCRLLGEPTPAEADPGGGHYCFERGARKDTGGEGWADVWKRHCFAWEYKARTLTSLYNTRPQWLADAHAALDAAVAEAYGWPAGIADEEALGELLALNDGCNVQQT